MSLNASSDASWGTSSNSSPKSMLPDPMLEAALTTGCNPCHLINIIIGVPVN